MQSIQSSSIVRTLSNNNDIACSKISPAPLNPSIQDMRSPSIRTASLSSSELPSDHFETLKSLVEYGINKRVNAFPENASISMSNIIVNFQKHFDEIILLREQSSVKWLDIPNEQLEDEINNFFEKSIEKLSQLQSFTADKILVFKENGSLRNFCLSHKEDLPTKTFLMDLEKFIEDFAKTSKEKQEYSLNIFPPAQNDDKYTFCVAGMNNSLNDAIESLKPEKKKIEISSIVKENITDFIFGNKVQDYIDNGNHNHIPSFFHSLFLPYSLVEKIDTFFLSPETSIPAPLIYKFLSEFSTQFDNVSQKLLSQHLTHTIPAELVDYSRDIKSLLETDPADPDGYLKISKLSLFEKLNIDVLKCITECTEHSNGNYGWNFELLKESLCSKIVDKLTSELEPFSSTFQAQSIFDYREIFNAEVPKSINWKNDVLMLENFINKVFCFSQKYQGASPILFIQTMQNLANSESDKKFSDGLEVLETLNDHIPADRPDLSHRLERTLARGVWLQINPESPYTDSVNNSKFELKYLIEGNGCSVEILNELKVNIKNNNEYKLPDRINLNSLLFNPHSIEIIQKISSYCSDYSKGKLLLNTCLNNQFEFLDILLDLEYKIFVTDSEGFTPLHYAASKGNLEIINKLLTKEPEKTQLLKRQDMTGQTALHVAIEEGHTNAVKNILEAAEDHVPYLLSQKNSYGFSPLHSAIIHNNSDMVKTLLNAASNESTKENIFQALSSDNETSVYLACKNGNKDILATLLNNAPSHLKNYLLNTRSSASRSPLHKAISNGHLELVKILLDQSDDYQKQSLYQATTKTEATALHYAVKYNQEEIVEMLLAKAPVYIRQDLLEAKMIKWSQDGQTHTPLQLAVENGYEKIVTALLKADTTSKTLKIRCLDFKPLNYAVNCGHLLVVKAILDHMVEHKIILNWGHKLDLISNAAYFKHPDIVELIRPYKSQTTAMKKLMRVFSK